MECSSRHFSAYRASHNTRSKIDRGWRTLTDDVFYDSARRRIYASFGEGSVMVYQQLDPDHYQMIARIPTTAGARTAMFSPESGQLFVAVPHRSNPAAEIRVNQAEP